MWPGPCLQGTSSPEKRCSGERCSGNDCYKTREHVIRVHQTWVKGSGQARSTPLMTCTWLERGMSTAGGEQQSDGENDLKKETSG